MAPSSSLIRVAVVGPPQCGKSSLIKRIVSHRFDNMPTHNKEFMGVPSDGRYVTLLSSPTIEGTLAKAGGPSQVLFEMQDQLASAAPLLHEPCWFDVLEDGPARVYTGMRPEHLADVAVVAMASTDSENSNVRDTEHWQRHGERRHRGIAAASANKEDSQAGAAGPEIGRKFGMAPEPDQHPLMAHQFKAQAVATTEAAASAADGIAHTRPSSLLTASHGTHGWIVAFDLGSRDSFEAARAMAYNLLERVGYERSAKQPCPVALTIVGNKADLITAHANTEPCVSEAELCELLAAGALPNAIVPQLRKQKVDRCLLKLCDAILQLRKSVDEAQSKAPSKGDGKEGAAATGSAGGIGAMEEKIGGVTSAVVPAIKKLRGQLDPMKVTTVKMSELETIMALRAVIAHPLTQSAEFSSAELTECLLACPALAIKYIDVSCKTNVNVHTLERVVLRAVRLLPSAEKLGGAVRQAKAGAGAGGSVFDSVKSLFDGSGVLAEWMCFRERTPMPAAEKTEVAGGAQ